MEVLPQLVQLSSNAHIVSPLYPFEAMLLTSNFSSVQSSAKIDNDQQGGGGRGGGGIVTKAYNKASYLTDFSFLNLVPCSLIVLFLCCQK